MNAWVYEYSHKELAPFKKLLTQDQILKNQIQKVQPDDEVFDEEYVKKRPIQPLKKKNKKIKPERTVLLDPVMEDKDPESDKALMAAHKQNFLNVCQKGNLSLNEMVGKPAKGMISSNKLNAQAVSLQIGSLLDQHEMESCHSFGNRR